MKKIWVVMLFFLLSGLPAYGENQFFHDISVERVRKGKKTGIVIRIKQAAPSSIKVYYDTQKPTTPDNLNSYWFYMLTRNIRKEHTILLSDLEKPVPFYFRLEKKTGRVILSPLYFWNGKRVLPAR